MTSEDAAKAFDRIADDVHELVRLAQQPAPRSTASPQDPYLSGQWHRRDGNIYGTPQHRGAPPSAPLDPQLKRDVPNVEARQGQTGIDVR